MITSNYIKVNELIDIQNLMTILLYSVHEICEKHGLVYNIFGGTMLGAIRHTGFIPWDDDVDITMPRKDYEKFIKIVKENYNNKFLVYSYPEQKDCCMPFAKFGFIKTIQIDKRKKSKYQNDCISIDVFPVDGYPNKNISRFLYRLKFFSRIRYYKVFNIPHKTYSAFIFNSLAKTVSLPFLLNKISSITQKNTFASSEYVFLHGASWYEKGKIKKSTYLDRKLYSFNGIKVWGISSFEEHLTKLYGDYMTLPPIESRIPKHNETDRYIDSSYLDSINENLTKINLKPIIRK